MNSYRKFSLCLGVCLAGFLPFHTAEAEDVAPVREHQTDFSTVSELGADIQRMMKSEHRPLFAKQPVFEDSDVRPLIRPVTRVENGAVQRGVSVSPAMIDLVNNVAHATAINSVRPGYLASYLELLSRNPAQPPELPDRNNEAFWTTPVLTEQLSHFHQISGFLVALNLAHHHQGYYDDHASKLTRADGSPAPIAAVMSKRHWVKSQRSAVQNCLESGIGMSGMVAFLEAVDGLSGRPEWMDFLVHPDVKLGKLKHELKVLDGKFFSGHGF